MLDGVSDGSTMAPSGTACQCLEICPASYRAKVHVRDRMQDGNEQPTVRWLDVEQQSTAGMVDTGGRVWSATTALCNILQCERCNLLQNVTFNRGPVQLLELGSGTGIVGMTAAILGAQVKVTDIGPSISRLCRAVSSCLTPTEQERITVEELDWTQTMAVRAAASQVDFVVAADVVFDTTWKALLQATIEILQLPVPPKIYFANNHRVAVHRFQRHLKRSVLAAKVENVVCPCVASDCHTVWCIYRPVE